MVSTARRCKLNTWLLFLLAVLLPLMTSGRPLLAACLYATRPQAPVPAEEAPGEDAEVLGHLGAAKSVAPRHRRPLVRPVFFVPLHPAASYSAVDPCGLSCLHAPRNVPFPLHDYLVSSLGLRGPPASV